MDLPEQRPRYDLDWIQYKVREGRFRITMTAGRNASSLGFEEADILACVLELDEGDFHKSMESETVKGTWQDVYRPRYEDVPIYLKLQLSDTADAVVIQFKRDTSR